MPRHTCPGLPSGFLGCPRLVLGYGMGVGFGFGDVQGLSLAILENPLISVHYNCNFI